METLESLQRKIDGATELGSVVRTMKAMAASNIGQYEMAVTALAEYYQTIELAIAACFKQENIHKTEEHEKINNGLTYAIVFGSEQGLVGQFNDVVSDFVIQSLNKMPGAKTIWSVGERVLDRLSDSGFTTTKTFLVPNSVSAIISLIGHILIDLEEEREKNKQVTFFIFHNRPKGKASYEPVCQRLLPLDKEWQMNFEKMKWPTNKLPQVLGALQPTLAALIREYLFVSIYKSCAESLASENASRLNAMQRAEKNIDELLQDLNLNFHRLRQSVIDEELFDLVAGFEAMKKK